MAGRMGVPFDRGKVLTHLWPLCWIGWRLCFEFDLVMAGALLLSWRLAWWLTEQLENWWCHWMLANLISSWHRASLKKKMKAEGIKFSPRPLGGPLLALPCRWMVLSCVMLSMWSVAMAGPVLQPTPVTWVAALGRVRDLRHPLLPPPPPKPPDPPDLSSVELSPSWGWRWIDFH